MCWLAGLCLVSVFQDCKLMEDIQFRRRWQPVHVVGEINNAPSDTIPDDALTVRQILDTYVGHPHMGNAAYHDGVYDEDGSDTNMSAAEFDSPFLDLATANVMDVQNYMDEKGRYIRSKVSEAKKRKKTEKTENKEADPSAAGTKEQEDKKTDK